MRSWTSRGVPEWSGGEELYIGSVVSAIRKDSGSPVLYRDHWMGPGGPSGGATHPGGPHGLKWEGEPTHSGLLEGSRGGPPGGAPIPEEGEPAPGGLGRPPWASPHAPRVGNPRGELPPCLGGQGTPFHPLAAAPNPSWVLAAPPPKGAYIKGGREGRKLQPWAPPSSPATPLSLSQKPCRRPATSTTTPSCCWIFINLSFPLARSIRRRRLPNHTCVECGGAVRSALVDLHQPLLPPCWIKKEETSLLRTCVERGGAVRSALGHR